MLSCATTAPPPAGTPPAAESTAAPVAAISPTQPQPEEEKEPSIEVLIDEAHHVFDEQSRLRRTYHLRYKILRPDALQSGWGVVSATWAPWYQDKPEIEATVTLPDGTKQTLDQSTLEVGGTRQRDPLTFSDVQRIRGPLPRLEVGAIVETNIVIAENKPFFEGGSATTFYFGGSTPTASSRFTVQAPERLPLTYVARGGDIKPSASTENGLKTLVFETGPSEPLKRSDPNRPPDAFTSLRVSVSVAGKWDRIARTYAEKVDERIRQSQKIEIEVPKKSGRPDTIAAVLKAVHDRIRYTGLEFGVSSIIPVAPHEVLQRGYGDCKDKATLVVRLLRERGIDARVALLSAGYRGSVPKSVPSISHFNHAVVYVPGDEPLWIDATIEHQKPRDIPLSLQGRLALIADAKTTDLVQIPEQPPERNKYLEVREIEMAEFGGGRVAESSEGRGNMDLRLRRRFADSKEADLKKMLEGYAKSLYGAEAVEAIVRSSDDYQKLSFTSLRAQRVYTSDNFAQVPLSKKVLFEWVPNAAFVPEKEEKKRELPLFFYESYSAEVIHHIVAPDGFVVREALEDKRTEMGPATLTRTWNQSGSKIDVTYRFNTGKRIWSVAERAAFSAAYDKLSEEDLLMLDHRGAALMARGEVRAALRVYRKLAKEHAKSAVHQSRLAEALRKAGFGEAARATAKRAVKMDPTSYFAQFGLGLALSSDDFGRDFVPGMDRDGAIAAYRAAAKLAPDHTNPRFNVALLLTHGKDGLRYGEGADLAQAIETWKKIEEELKDGSVNNNLREALLMSKRFEDLHREVEKAPSSLSRNSLLIASVAVLEGQKKTERVLSGLGSSVDSQAILQKATQYLLRARKYAAAASLAALSAQGGDLSTQGPVEMIRLMRPWDQLLKESKGPERVVREFTVASVEEDNAKALRRFLAKGLRAEEEIRKKKDVKTFSEMSLDESRYSNVMSRLRGQFSKEFVLDSAMSLANFQIKGSDAIGYRIKNKPLVPGQKIMSFFVVREGGKYKIRGATPFLSTVGAQATALLGRGKTEAAQQWLDWALDEMPAPTTEDAMRGPVFPRIWSRTKNRTPDTMRAAAAVLMALSRATSRKAIAPLEKAVEKAKGNRKDLLTRSLDDAYRSMERWRDTLRTSRILRKRFPLAPATRWRLVSALRFAKNTDEAERMLRDHLAERPFDPPTSMDLAFLLSEERNDPAGAMKVLKEVIEEGEPTNTIYNAYAWVSLFDTDPPNDALPHSERSATGSKFNNHAILHTLAAVYAEHGHPAKAMRAFLRILQLRGSAGPHSDDWFVFGRIAEAYDLKDTAKKAYWRVKRPEHGINQSTWTLAQRGLKRIR